VHRDINELEGSIVAPFDAPWVRMTVITDPQGATFTASKFVPENKERHALTRTVHRLELTVRQ
jgi:hypothetical protein